MDLFGTAGGLWTNYSNQKFAEEMSSTQHQRAVADMKAAGLNPTQGVNPSSAPPGQATNPVSPGSSAKNVIDIATGYGQANKVNAEAKSADAAARIADSTADVVTKENSAYSAALSSKAGQGAAVYKKYQGSGPTGWLGGAGAVAGLGQGQGWGGTASAKATGMASDLKAAFGGPGGIGHQASAKAADMWSNVKAAAGVYD